VRLSHLIFDLDDTLYPPSRGVVARVHSLISEFMVERLGIAADEADALRARYREELGTTLNGLMRYHAVAPDDFLAHVHAIDIDALLAPDADLLAMLRTLPHEKIIFTNGSASHAERVLARLGVRECFADVFSLERVDYMPKPQPAAFKAVLAALAVPATRCLVIDDRLDNLRAAGALGMRTLWVGASAAARDGIVGIDAAVASVLEMPAALRTVEATCSA
jgi:putative hydrolase of the HAD superfamily